MVSCHPATAARGRTFGARPDGVAVRREPTGISARDRRRSSGHLAEARSRQVRQRRGQELVGGRSSGQVAPRHRHQGGRKIRTQTRRQPRRAARRAIAARAAPAGARVPGELRSNQARFGTHSTLTGAQQLEVGEDLADGERGALVGGPAELAGELEAGPGHRRPHDVVQLVAPEPQAADPVDLAEQELDQTAVHLVDLIDRQHRLDHACCTISTLVSAWSSRAARCTRWMSAKHQRAQLDGRRHDRRVVCRPGDSTSAGIDDGVRRPPAEQQVFDR